MGDAMTDLRKAVEMAVPLLIGYREYSGDHRIANRCGEVLEALRQALAQPEQEELIQFKDGKWSYVRKPWQGLTNEELVELREAHEAHIFNLMFAVEAKVKEKNNAV